MIKGPRGYPKDIPPERMFRKIKKVNILSERSSENIKKVNKLIGIQYIRMNNLF